MLDKEKTFRVRECAVAYRLTDIELPENKAESSADIYEIFKHLQDADREKLCVLHLTARSKIIAFEVVSIGTLTASLISVREIFKSVFLHNAFSIVLVHNHPSGSPTPSAEDQQIFRLIKDACKTLQVTFLDNIIIGEDSYYSFADEGHF